MAQYEAGIKTKKNIYLASEKLFYEKGYDNTTITNITDYANANRGSFYHHYKNKLELGTQVYWDFAKTNSRIGNLFNESIETPIGVTLSVKTFWYLFYMDKNIRRFSVDLANENILQAREDPFVYNMCLQLTEKEFTDKEMKFISITNIGLVRQLTIDAFFHTDKYDYHEISDYYMSTVFRLFDIDEGIVENVLVKSRELFSQCNIHNDGFNVSFGLKNT